MTDRAAIIADLKSLLDRGKAGLDALAALPDAPAASATLPDLAALFGLVRRFYGPIQEQAFVEAVDAWYKGEPVPLPKHLVAEDFTVAADRLGVPVYKIRAVDEVESAGGGLEPGRADILALDGPGGFIDGELPKILFEAHKFSKWTGHKYDASNPDISSAKWNPKLYKGGQSEWGRLWRAMQLDREAALKSASWGRYQILGENYKLAGFSSVEDFVKAMQRDERAHLDAFCSFVEKSGLVEELRAISTVKDECRAFAAGYNGPAYASGNYDGKLAAAVKDWKSKVS